MAKNKKIEKAKGNYNLLIVLGFIVVITLVSFFAKSNPFLKAEVILDVKPTSFDYDNITYYNYDQSKVEVISDSLFGMTYYFHNNDYLKKRERTSIGLGDSFSVSIFAFVEDNKTRNNLGLISSSYQDNSSGFRFKYRDFEEEDRIYVQIGDSIDYASIPNNKCYMSWCHYAFTYNSGNGRVKIYVNGEKIGEFTSKKKVNLDNKISIGNTIDTNGEFFIGKIGNAKIYKGILNDKEIEEISSILN